MRDAQARCGHPPCGAPRPRPGRTGPRAGRLAAAVLALAAVAGAADLGPSFAYDLRPFRQTDPKFILFDELAPLKPGLTELRAVAVAGPDRILVAGDRKLLALHADGTAAGATDLDAPARCLAVAPDGTVYAGMRDHVEVFDAAGTRTATWPRLGDKAVLTSVAATTGAVFVADAGQRVVRRYDRGGKLLGTIDGRDPARPGKGVVVPSPHFDLALGPGDALWIVDPGRHQLSRYGADGVPRATWGQTAMALEGFCGCCNPTDLAIARDGSFFTSEKGLARVKVYGADGAFAGVVAGPEQFADDVTGLDLALDAQGRVLVLDPKAGTVRVFARKEAKP
jgi:hypothetical protein